MIHLAQQTAVLVTVVFFPQLGRRNLTADQYRLVLGRRYNRAKKAGPGRPQGSTEKECVQNAPINRTADTLAKEHGVNESTIRRAGKFADMVEAYARMTGKAQTTLHNKVMAFRVASNPHMGITAARDHWRALSEVHAAPRWMWKMTSAAPSRRCWRSGIGLTTRLPSIVESVTHLLQESGPHL